MTTRFLTTIILIATFQSLSAQVAPVSNVHIGFVYPLSTNGSHAAEYTNYFSLHALAGVSRNEKSFCAAGFASVIKDSATGFVGSGFANVIGKGITGTQLAGFINTTGNGIKGFAGAGFINISGNLQGAAAAGFANIFTGEVNGVECAGFINTAKNANTQVAGFVNTAADVKGAQIAGFANITGAKDTADSINTRGNAIAQVAGFINIANDVKGAQVAGFINIAHKVKGPQIAGFINIADSSNFPIGIINLIKNGDKTIGIAVDETGTTMASFRSGGRYTYGIIGMGFNPAYNSNVYAMQAGIGGRLPLSKVVRLSAEAYVTSLYDFYGHSDLRSGIRLLPSVKLGIVELFAGPSFNFTASGDIQGVGKTGYSVWRDTYNCHTYDLSAGFEGGVQLHIEGRKR